MLMAIAMLLELKSHPTNDDLWKFPGYPPNEPSYPPNEEFRRLKATPYKQRGFPFFPRHINSAENRGAKRPRRIRRTGEAAI